MEMVESCCLLAVRPGRAAVVRLTRRSSALRFVQILVSWSSCRLATGREAHLCLRSESRRRSGRIAPEAAPDFGTGGWTALRTAAWAGHLKHGDVLAYVFAFNPFQMS